MSRVTMHIRDNEIDIISLPDGLEVEVIDFDSNGGEGQRLRFFKHGGDVIEEVLGIPNIVEGNTRRIRSV